MRTITVGKLKELLADYEDDLPVAFSSDYGDRGHTEQALAIRGNLDMKLVERSGYSESGWAVRENEPDADERELEDFEEPKEVLIIN